jgi:hypothetical protein
MAAIGMSVDCTRVPVVWAECRCAQRLTLIDFVAVQMFAEALGCCVQP